MLMRKATLQRPSPLRRPGASAKATPATDGAKQDAFLVRAVMPMPCCKRFMQRSSGQTPHSTFQVNYRYQGTYM